MAKSPRRATTPAERKLLWRARPVMAAVLWGSYPFVKNIAKIPKLGWVSANPRLGREILTNPRDFTIIGEGGVGHLWAQVLGAWVLDLFDGPGHHDLRSRTRELFTEAAAQTMIEQAWGNRLKTVRERVRAGQSIDVARLARVLVGSMIISLLGLPRERAADGLPTEEAALAVFNTGEHLAKIALGSAGSTHLDPAQVARAKKIVAELTVGVPQGWREAEDDKLLGRCRELGVTLEETTGLASLLMVAGTETSASAMARITALLIDTGEQHRLIEAMQKPEFVPAGSPAGAAGRLINPGEADPVENVVREGLRMTSPASVIGRGVVNNVEVGGKLLRAGERVMILTWSANAAAGKFQADRPYVRENRQLWFGAGRHLCLGAALARAEIGHLLHALWDDAAPLRVVKRTEQRRVLVPGYEQLLVARA